MITGNHFSMKAGRSSKLMAFFRKNKWLMLLLLPVIAWYCFSLPDRLFDAPYSTVLQSEDGHLLSATIADDGQWRFPAADSVPEKFAVALVTFEDKRFRSHPGFDILSLARALKQNMRAGKIVSGGSTITMQVIRLSRKNSDRTFLEKALEIILATRLELGHSKAEILNHYASHAPFGGNVVGLEAACWRYFGSDPKELSWGQAALLAVLPNAPSLMHPGKNRSLLKAKRDRLLEKLKAAGQIDEFTCRLSKEEPVPDDPFPLPRYARHLIAGIAQDGYAGKKVTSTINFNLQQRVEELVNGHYDRLKINHIYNAAAIVLDVRTGSVLAYSGNVTKDQTHENEVDIIRSPRSTGSILKPFLYAAMLDEGKILPKTLLPDVPVLINGFAPQNFTHEYDGAVPADKALIRSLNVPAVYMLREFRYEKFYTLLKNLGMTTLPKPPDHYGLSLILGGAEGTLWDVTGMYASMARTLNNYFEVPGKNRYRRSDFHPPHPIPVKEKHSRLEESSWIGAASIYNTYETLKEVYRPGEETGWRYFSHSKDIAWKTGTSFGYRDAWAIGVTPEYAVGIWAGNADGEGRPGLTGTEAAAPLMFDIFSLLPSGKKWFDIPAPELQEIILCRSSGHRTSGVCPQTDTVKVSIKGLTSKPCPYHRTVHLTPDMKYQVNDQCQRVSAMKHVSWFVLPPVQEFYYRSVHQSYKPLPPFRSGCGKMEGVLSMDMIYPKNHSRIFIPRELDGQAGSSVFRLAHRDPQALVFWHLDGRYIGATKSRHNLALNPPAGKHILTMVDESGTSLERHFEVISGPR